MADKTDDLEAFASYFKGKAGPKKRWYKRVPWKKVAKYTAIGTAVVAASFSAGALIAQVWWLLWAG